jgi:hypothetical protein
MVFLRQARPFGTSDAPATTAIDDAVQLDRISGV